MRRLERIYEQTRAQIVDIVGAVGDDVPTPTVPACPGWTVHDVLAHVSGMCVDVMSGSIPTGDLDEWTAAQVATRQQWTLGDVLAEWDDVGPQLAAHIDDFPGRLGHQIVADLAVHEHDVRGALGRSGRRDAEGVTVGLELLVSAVFHSALDALGLGPVEVRAGDGRWVIGTGGPATVDVDAWRAAVLRPEPDPEPSTPPTAVLTVEPFELFRAITGRRSAAQIRQLDWDVDPAPYIPAFGFGPFTVRAEDLEE